MLLSDAIGLRLSTLRRLGRSEKTIKFYTFWLDQLQAFLLFNELELISLSQLRSFLDSLVERGLSKSSQRGASMTIRVFFKWCVAEGLLKTNPAERLELAKCVRHVPDTFDVSEVLALLNAAAGSKHPERDQLLVALLTETGIRLSEVAGLTLSDVKLDARCVLVMGKGGKQRFVPFAEAAAKLMVDYLAVRDLPGRSLFGLTDSGIRLALRRLGDKVGVRCTPHKFRRTSATLTARAGGGSYWLQQKFGWESQQVAKFYIDLAQMEDSRLKTSPLDRFVMPPRQ